MTLALILQSLWLAAPVIAGGAVHIAVIKLGVLQPLARWPLDGGARIRQRRVLGENKTVRGAVTMIGATVLCALGQAWLVAQFDWARGWLLNDFQGTHPAGWGALLGAGYIAGELPNSFVKRQLDIAPGARAPGWSGPVFWLGDQVDSLVGMLVFMCAVWVPPFEVVLVLLAITLAVHPAMALAMKALGLKSRVG